MKTIAIVMYLLFSSFVYSQTKITVYDDTTKKPVQYANIWKDKTLFVTADSTGSFVLKNHDFHRQFKITAIGYTDTITTISQDVFIRQENIRLEEVKILKRKNQTTVKLGKAKRGNANYGVQFDSKMPRTSKYFPNPKSEISFVSKVKFFAQTSAENRMVSLLFFSVNDKGEPDKIIKTENVMHTLKKGTHLAEIDVSKLNIVFPKEGFFVVIQHLLLEQNKNYSGDPNPNAFVYEPFISVNYCDEYKDTWYFKDEIWQKNQGFYINMELVFTD